VDETIRTWVKIDGCPNEPSVRQEPDKGKDGTRVTRMTYGPGKNGAEVVLFKIEEGGHTWPGMQSGVKILGRSTQVISANDLIWEFFLKHPLK
jgi:polyhydroxybutyrate depolymerase